MIYKPLSTYALLHLATPLTESDTEACNWALIKAGKVISNGCGKFSNGFC